MWKNLYKLRIEESDVFLKNHIGRGKIVQAIGLVDIRICGSVLMADILKNVKEAEAYSV